MKFQFLFDLYLNPQSLTIKPALKSLTIPQEIVKTLPQIFVGTPPCMMHTHGVVCSDRSILERKIGLRSIIFMKIFIDCSLFLPLIKPLVLHIDEKLSELVF